MLVVIYELAEETEWLPYLASIFFPLVPLWIYGRAAAERPACERKEALWWGWQDAVLPFIHGLRAPEDTLFIVAEADWIMAEEHETVLMEYVDDLRSRFVWCPPAPVRTRSSDQPSAMPDALASDQPPMPKAAQRRTRKRPKARAVDPREDNPTDAPQPPRLWQWWFPERVRRPLQSGEEVEPTAPMLMDLVYFCNVASAHGVGELVWPSYDGYRRGPREVPGNGSTAIALTKTGAARLLTEMIMDGHSGHIDQFLSSLLFSTEHDSDNAQLIRQTSSYAWHSFGAYHGHITGCDKKKRYRVCHWLPPKQPYTRRLVERPADDCRYNRWLVRCRPTGTARDNKVVEVDPTIQRREAMWLTHFDENVLTNGAPDPSKCAAAVLEEVQNRRRERAAARSTGATVTAEVCPCIHCAVGSTPLA